MCLCEYKSNYLMLFLILIFQLKRHIEELEEQNLKTKPWQLSGEVGAGARPENSLLEEHLDFDHNSKPRKVFFF